MLKRRTDLAVEATQLWQEQAGETTQLRGVQARDSVREGYKVTTVRILDESGAQALGKPVGTYITVELDGLLRREEDGFSLALPFRTDRRFPLTPLFCFAKVESLGEEHYAIFCFNRCGCPRPPHKGETQG